MNMMSLFEKFSALQDVVIPETTTTEYNSLSRRDIRALIFYILYMHEAMEDSIEAMVENFSRAFHIEIPHHSEVVMTAKSIISQKDKIDAVYAKLLENWSSERISLCTKLILRFGIWELLNTKQDSRVIINEAIELAKLFSDDDSYRFINGILDKIAKN
jgi:transcription antitermination protein NusB